MLPYHSCYIYGTWRSKKEGGGGGGGIKLKGEKQFLWGR